MHHFLTVPGEQVPVTTDAVAADVLAQLGRWQLSWFSVAQISVGT